MSANVVNLTYEKGTDFAFDFPVQYSDGSPFPLAGCTVTAQVRDTVSSATARPVMTVALDTPIASTVRCSFTHAQASAALVANGVTWAQLTAYVWECDITIPGGAVVRLLEGTFSVAPGGNR